MVDKFVKNSMFNYRSNSSLVLEAPDRDIKSRMKEASGEVESLHGKLGSERMGSRVQKSKLPIEDSISSKMKRNQIEEEDDATMKRRKTDNKAVKGASLAVINEESEYYRPKTRETKVAYEELLSIVQRSLGDQPQDIYFSAADEILAILKDEYVKDPDKLKMVEKIIRISPDVFHKITNLGKSITDYKTEEKKDEEDESAKLDEGMGVAVVFDDEDDAMDELGGDSDEEDNDEEDGERNLLKGGDNYEGDEVDDQFSLSVHDIDAYWLQRQLSKFYNDANISAKLAEDTLNILQLNDERTCENKLVVLLDCKFEFIKLLLRNKSKIYYCTRLKQAQDDSERSVVENEMRNDEEGAAILAELYQQASADSWTQDRIGQFATKARKEARALIQGGVQQKETGDVEETILGESVENGLTTGGQKTIDLDTLQFAQGGHVMTNTRCELPSKSWRAQKKGYEEVHVPAVRPIIPEGEKLVNISDLPSWTQPAFAGMKTLNRIQSRMVKGALHSSENILLCAPTGAGKTNVALLCMLNIISQYRNEEDGSFNLDAFKIVYIAPMKALVQECVQNFGRKLQPFGINVRELSGDQNLTMQQIQDTQVIVTTPEKWDIVTRKAGDRAYTQLVRLMIIDEIHLLHDDRGPVLESLVARTVRNVESTQDMVRMVGLSATLPNFEDVAAFLRVDPEKGLFFFDNSFRPVPLQQQYIGITEKKALKRFQLMNEICYEKVLQHAGRNQVLIFTHSRAETAKTAKALRDMAVENDTLSQFVRDESATKEILRTEAQGVKNADLKDILPYGFAIHHAGMVKADRNLVEDLFADKHVQVLVSTATLAWGVNLPAHTVIIKGTQMYSPEKGSWVELSPLDIMQMMGRAGRYGLDSEGEGIIITQHSELQYYLSLMNQQLPIESQFIKKLPDMLNAEIVLGSVQSVREAATWLGYTYLYIRMLRNPSIYGINVDDMERDKILMQRRLDLAHSAATVLDKHNLIKYDRKTGYFQITTLGRVASFYYISHESMHVFNEFLKPTMNEIEIFRLFSLSGEFKNINVREEEKLELLRLATRVPIPVKESMDEPSAKVNILLQAYISRLKLDGFALMSDMIFVQQSACRLMRALFEITLKRGWASVAEKMLVICKMVEKRIWSSQSPLRQFTSIPEAIIRKLEKNSDINWERYYDLKPQDLGEMVKVPNMGKTLHKFVHMFPKLDLSAQFQPITRSLLRVDMTITPDFQFDLQVHEFAQVFWILVEDVNGEYILHSESFTLLKPYATESHYVSFTVPIQDPLPPQYFIKIVSDRWLHAETTIPVSFRHLILPQKFLPCTELLDLQPLPVAALRNPAFESLYPNIRKFNPIQTQTFSSLYETDDNVLLCAPTSSGKVTCAEFALLRLFNKTPNAKAVYICLKQEVCDHTYQLWSSKFQETLGIHVVKLLGDTTKDLKLIESGNIIIATAVQWDVLSRRWKQRKLIQNISLYIFDEIQLIGGEGGVCLEIVISRARYVAFQLKKHIRLVGLGIAIANAKDIGDWLGVPQHAYYNFSPSVRPVPLEIKFVTFESNHYSNRLLSMAKSVYNAVINIPSSGQSVVFVPSRKQTQLTAIDLITYAGASGKGSRFVNIDIDSSDDMASFEAIVNRIRDKSLKETLSKGIAFLHNSLGRGDTDIVLSLYSKGIISVLICPHEYCWSINVQAQLVVIMETTYYDGHSHAYVDVSITDLIHMMGLASKRLENDTTKCVILSHAPKKEYLKRLINEPLPIESHLDQFLTDHLSAEIVTKTIENKQEAVDYLTWTFYYRRLSQNPNYYNMQGSSHRHISDHLSEIIETTVDELANSKCILVENDLLLSSLNLGMIASYYYIQYTTIDMFSSSVTAKTKLKGVMEIVTAASEFNVLPIRQNEDTLLKSLSRYLPQALPDNTNYESIATKCLILLQAHFSRIHLPADLIGDVKLILKDSVKLLQALVDVISSQGWLKPALAVMEMSQMVIQGQWDKDDVLLQIPHFNAEVINKCKQLDPPVETVSGILELEDEDRNNILSGFTPQQTSDVAMFCNAYPSIDLSFATSIENGEVLAGDNVTVEVSLRREIDDDVPDLDIGKVVCPRYPGEKIEGWWLVIGDKKNNTLLSVKRIALPRATKVALEFSAPSTPGDYTLTLYLMCDSYLGCDLEEEIEVNVLPNENEDTMEED